MSKAKNGTNGRLPTNYKTMPDLPNIKREVLEYVIEKRRSPGIVAVNLRAFAEERDYEEHRVANAVHEMPDTLDWGVSPMHPWPAEQEAAREWFDKWNADPPDGFDSAGWYGE